MICRRARFRPRPTMIPITEDGADVLEPAHRLILIHPLIAGGHWTILLAAFRFHMYLKALPLERMMFTDHDAGA